MPKVKQADDVKDEAPVVDVPKDEVPAADPAPEPDPQPEDEPAPDKVQPDGSGPKSDEPVDEDPPPVEVAEPPADPECEFDIRVGDVWTCPAGNGETVHVVGFTEGGDPIVQSEDTSEQRTVPAATLAQWRHDGPTHHESGSARA